MNNDESSEDNNNVDFEFNDITNGDYIVLILNTELLLTLLTPLIFKDKDWVHFFLGPLQLYICYTFLTKIVNIYVLTKLYCLKGDRKKFSKNCYFVCNNI